MLAQHPRCEMGCCPFSSELRLISRAEQSSKADRACCGCAQGGSVAQLLRKQMVSVAHKLYSDLDALKWCLDLARALQHLHAQSPQIIHRCASQHCQRCPFLRPLRTAPHDTA